MGNAANSCNGFAAKARLLRSDAAGNVGGLIKYANDDRRVGGTISDPMAAGPDAKAAVTSNIRIRAGAAEPIVGLAVIFGHAASEAFDSLESRPDVRDIHSFGEGLEPVARRPA
jgi:hypothetical protein